MPRDADKPSAPSVLPADPLALAMRLTEEGAVMTVWNSPALPYLVGKFQWLDPNRIFFFAANGDSEADGHVLQFDTVALADRAVQFFAGGRIVGRLAAIDAAEVEDRDDYRVGWQIWQQVAPMRAGFVARLIGRIEER